MKLVLIILAVAIFYGASSLPSNKETSYYAGVAPAVSGVSAEAPSPAQAVNVAGAPSTFSREIAHKGGICVNARTNEPYTNVIVSRDEVAHYASKYWNGNNLEIALALSVKEGQRDLNCIGDETPQYYGKPTHDGRHWGESVGLYQFRTIIEARGKGGCEDIEWQRGDIDRQTQCAFQKWDARDSWQPWSAYTSGRYKAALGK